MTPLDSRTCTVSGTTTTLTSNDSGYPRTTTLTSDRNTNIDNTTSTYSVSYYHEPDLIGNDDFLKKYWKSVKLKEIKSGWHQQLKLQPTKILRNIRLRNICADGRGWAC